MIKNLQSLEGGKIQLVKFSMIFQKFLKKLVFPLVLSYILTRISPPKYFSSDPLVQKTLTECRRVAYFFPTTNPQRPQARNSPARRFDSPACMFRVDRPSNFLFLSKILEKMATKPKDSKNWRCKKLYILYKLLFLMVFSNLEQR